MARTKNEIVHHPDVQRADGDAHQDMPVDNRSPTPRFVPIPSPNPASSSTAPVEQIPPPISLIPSPTTTTSTAPATTTSTAPATSTSTAPATSPGYPLIEWVDNNSVK